MYQMALSGSNNNMAQTLPFGSQQGNSGMLPGLGGTATGSQILPSGQATAAPSQPIQQQSTPSKTLPFGSSKTASDKLNQSQISLGHSQGLLESFGNFESGIMPGIAKSVGSTVKGMSDIGQTVAQTGTNAAIHGMNAVTGGHVPDMQADYMPEVNQALQPHGAGEQTGNVIGQVGQFLGAGGLDLAKGAVGAVKAIPAAIDAVKAEGIGGLLSKGFQGAKTAIQGLANQKADAAALDTAQKAIIPKLSSGEMQDAKIITPSKGAPYVDMTGDPKHMEAANAVKGIVKGNDVNVDKTAVENRITHVAENEIKPTLTQNKVPLNYADVRGKMELSNPPINFKQPGQPNAAAMTAWDNTREVMLSHLDDFMTKQATKEGDFGSQTDMNHLWDGLKSAADKAEAEIKADFGTPEYQGKKAAVQAFRADGYQLISDAQRFPGQQSLVNKAEEFVNHAKGSGIQIDTPEQRTAFIKQLGLQSTPEGEKNAAFFDNKISELKNLYRAKDNISTWIPDYLKENQTMAQRHPIASGALKLGLGVGLGGTALGVANEIKNQAGL